MTRPDLYGMPETDASKLQGDNDVLRAKNAGLRAALRQIAAIENQGFGGDWDEIEQAREIANKALADSQ